VNSDGIRASELLASLARRGSFSDALLGQSSDMLDGANHEDLANALVISDHLTSLQHRQRVVEALHHTAVDLTSLTDVNQVLQAIVSRSRELIMADVAYITLMERDIGGTRVRASVGTTSSSFEALTLKPDEGLGGLVVRTGAPVVTSNYSADQQFTHVPLNDEAVASERLRSMVGVPLRVGSDILGALFVANRGLQPFNETDIALISSLAAHAAVAVSNAKLYEDSRLATEQLDLAHMTIRQHAEELEKDFSELVSLSEAILRPEPLAVVVGRAAEAIGGDLALVLKSGAVLARHVRVNDGGGLARLLERVPAQTSVIADTAVFRGSDLGLGDAKSAARGFVSCLLARGEVLGYAYAWLPEGDIDESLRAVRRIFITLSFAMMGEQFERQYQERSLAQFFDYLSTSDRVHGPDVAMVARGFGITMQDYSHVCSWAGREIPGTIAKQIVSALTNAGIKASMHDGDVAALVPRDFSPHDVHNLAAAVDGEVLMACGIGSLDTQSWDEGLRQAKACAQALLALGRTGEAADRVELGLFGVLAANLGGSSVDAIMDRELADVQRHDAEHGSLLLDTIEGWFEDNYSSTKTAKRLHIHVNTLYRRLARIEKLLGAGWDRGDRALELRVALRLRRLSARAVGRAGS
jgi:hypothetical protein